MSKNYVIIGSGVAAVTAAKAIRDQDQDGTIMIFGRENSLPYNRIKLSKELFSDLRSEKNFIKKEKWYIKNNILMFPDSNITNINIGNRSVETGNGSLISYDKLLLCTGSKNRKLPIEGASIKGVFTIREMQDAEVCKAYIEGKNHISVIGGGVQGLETAWSFLQAGKKVSIIEAGPRLMARQLDQKTSQLLKNKIEEKGVKVLLNASIERISGEEQVSEVIINTNEMVCCDCVIYSIGVQPNIELASATPIETNRGIIVNEEMKTSVDDIYAAGDVTEINGEVDGLWIRAMEQGRVAGTNMAVSAIGSENLYYKKTVPVTVFNAFDMELFSIGQVNESLCDMTITEDAENYTSVFIKDNKIVGVISLQGVAELIPYSLAIENEISLESIDLKDTSISEIMNEVKNRQAVIA